MICNYIKSEGGKVTVVAIGNSLMIHVKEPTIYVVVNPDNPGVFAPNVKNIEISDADTPEDVLKKIDDEN